MQVSRPVLTCICNTTDLLVNINNLLNYAVSEEINKIL